MHAAAAQWRTVALVLYCQHHCLSLLYNNACYALSVQAELQQLSEQVNQQIQVYTKQGFQIKDVNSGMAHRSSKAPFRHILPSFHEQQPVDSRPQNTDCLLLYM